jgi:hypothetical protein
MQSISLYPRWSMKLHNGEVNDYFNIAVRGFIQRNAKAFLAHKISARFCCASSVSIKTFLKVYATALRGIKPPGSK